MRKDVTCTFGIMRGCWRILKCGIRVHNTEVGDNIWLTSCVLHNMLLNVDGLSMAWKDGVCSCWEMEIGEFRDEDIPFALRRLVDPTGTEDFRLRYNNGLMRRRMTMTAMKVMSIAVTMIAIAIATEVTAIV